MYDYVEIPKPKESGFDLSQSNKFTMDFGDLVPVFKQEVLPSDEFKVKSQFMVRMAPLANPIFTKINAQIHYFFVPNRLLWDGGKNNDWQTFITGGRSGNETPAPPFMTLDNIIKFGMESSPIAGDAANNRGAQTLADYLGVPLIDTTQEDLADYQYYKINMLPFLAYQKIYDDWFRDPNVTESIFDSYENPWMYGGDLYRSTNQQAVAQLLMLRKRSWKKDYFTSALPWAQRGEEVRIPTNAAFYADYEKGDSLDYSPSEVIVQESFDENTFRLSPYTMGTIRELRNASALQLWLEKNAIGGARYIEQLLAHFGVYSDDARMQRAEYLGSVKAPIVISEVQSNAETDDTPLGKLGGKGVSYGNDFAFNRKFTEHGWIIGIMSIMPDASYCQGFHRSLTHRNDKLDYAFPEFAELGLQEIDNSEIYFAGDNYDFGTFGYNDRYAEYKSNYNEVHGLFKDENETLAQYNMTRFFEDHPILGSDFLEVNERAITSPFVDTAPNRGNLWVDLWTDCKAIRPLPKNSLPLY